MENIRINTDTDINVDPRASFSGGDSLGARRIFHTLERRYLSTEAQLMIYSLLDAQFILTDVMENAIQQAVILGSLSGTVIDASTFQAVLEAVTLNPAFRIPFVAASAPFKTWVC